MKDHVKVFALGGLDEFGKNCYVVSINGDLFIIECGALLPDKSTPGIDYIIPNSNWLIENKDNIKAYIICHGHDDEIGALPYFYQNCPAPVYCTKITKSFIVNFCTHINVYVNIDFIEIEPTSTHKISGHVVHFIQTCHSAPGSFGVAIETDLGNVVFFSDFIVEYNTPKSYTYDLNALGVVAEKNTLLLMCESTYADRLGYTSPYHRITPLIEHIFTNDAEGRIFIAVPTPNIYNIDEIIQLCIHTNRKLCAYDLETELLIKRGQAVGELALPLRNTLSLADINRVRDQEVVFLMTGYGHKLYKKIIALAKDLHEEKRISLKDSDYFIIAAPASSRNEIIATDALDEIYRSGVNVRNLSGKELYKMHASEQDIQSLISILKPKYYFPIKGDYKHLLANAMMVSSLGQRLSHQNIFVLDNGMVLDIKESGATVLPESQSVPVGDVLIDGLGIGENTTGVLGARNKLGSEGICVISLGLSKAMHKILTNIDIEFRGFSCRRDLVGLKKDITKFVESIVETFLEEPDFEIIQLKTSLAEQISRFIRKDVGKQPVVYPIVELLD